MAVQNTLIKANAAALYDEINDGATLTNTTIATNDLIGIADVSAATGKKITINNLSTFIKNNYGLNCSLSYFECPRHKPSELPSGASASNMNTIPSSFYTPFGNNTIFSIANASTWGDEFFFLFTRNSNYITNFYIYGKNSVYEVQVTDANNVTTTYTYTSTHSNDILGPILSNTTNYTKMWFRDASGATQKYTFIKPTGMTIFYQTDVPFTTVPENYLAVSF